MSDNNKYWMLAYSVNDYNQHGSYPKCIWKEKPTMEILGQAMGVKFPCDNDQGNLAIVNVWQGQSVEMSNLTWSLAEHTYGSHLEE